MSLLRKTLSYLALSVLVALALLPFLYMISLSLQSDAETMAGIPVIIPETLQWRNYIDIWDRAPFARFIFNSFFVAMVITVSHLLFSPLAGYVFAKYTFPLKDIIFFMVLGTLMIPFFVRMIPLYMMMARLDWLDSYQALISPFMMSAFSIFLMRQFIQPIPTDLIDAGRIDGASELRIYWDIILPQTRPALATLALFTFIFQFNEFIWPLIVVNTTLMRTMTIGLTLFNQEYFTQWNYTATGGMIMFIPSLILFLFTQRYYVQGVVLTGLKG
jgi:multiple sugar transport system permease protein